MANTMQDGVLAHHAPVEYCGPRRRGRLRIYLGMAPGVGKTYAMLNEGRRRAARGTDVVIGVVNTHGRSRTEAQIGDLEIVPRKQLCYRGAMVDEMDFAQLVPLKSETGVTKRAQYNLSLRLAAHPHVRGDGSRLRLAL